MAGLAFAMGRDLYVVLLIVFLIDQIPGNDLLHDVTRKCVVAATVVILCAKLVQPLVASPGQKRSACREKRTASGVAVGLEWASVEMQGWRPAMEDATCILPSLPDPLTEQALFAVFDGHGGAQVSRIASQEFPKVLAACASNLARLKAGGAGSSSGSSFGDAIEETPSPAAADVADAPAAAPAPAQAATGGVADGREKEDAMGDPEGKQTGTSEGLRERPAHDICKLLHLAMLSMDALLRRGGDGRAAVGRPRSDPLGRIEATMQTRNAFNLVGSTALVALVERDFAPDGADASGSTASGSTAGGGSAASGGGGSGGGGEADASAVPMVWAPRRVVVANVGDSRAVLCRAGRAVDLSNDHKPELKAEEARIRGAGGLVAQAGPCYRVDGWGLNLSRALGDFHYKARTDLPAEQQKVIAVPEIRTLELTEDDEFIVLGCDGIFELNSSQGAVDIVRRALESGLSLEKAAEELVDKSCSSDLSATRGRGGDNCSAVVFRVLRR
mmetsp:Transcript_153650/g.491301  ORF Transcript_153650/g.491301 Transcript_153650/m.491301 type:complete len:502 (-) Transcript_153650:148-1653(-)